MSNESDLAALDKRLTLNEGATQSMLNKQDRQLEEIAKINRKLTTLEDEMHLIVEMFRAQASQIASIQQLLNDRLPPKEQ